MVGGGQLVPEAAPEHAPEAVRVRSVRVQGGARGAARHARAQGAQQEGVRQVHLPGGRPAPARGAPARRTVSTYLPTYTYHLILSVYSI